MFRKEGKLRKRSMVKGALAGLVGGIAGSAAKAFAEKIYPPVDFPVQSVGEKKVAAQAIHLAYGAVAGAVYGAAVELEPKAGAWRGAAFGLALNKLGRKTPVGLPSLELANTGITAPTMRNDIRKRQSEWVTHAVFGVATDTVRRLVRRGL